MLCHFQVLAGILSGIANLYAALPVAVDTKVAAGNSTMKIVMVDNDTEIDAIVSKSFPEILRSDVNPFEYLRARGYNTTTAALLPFLYTCTTPGWSISIINCPLYFAI